MNARSGNTLEGVGVSLSESARAALVIEGEARARAWLDRLQADVAQPGELAALLAYLRGELLHGACKLIEKALRGRHA